MQSIRVFDRLTATKKPAGVAPAADQPGKADDGRLKSPTLPEQVFDDGQWMFRQHLAHRLGNDFTAIRIHRCRTHEQNLPDYGCLDSTDQALESGDVLGGDVDDQRIRLQKRIDIVQGFADIDDEGFARQGSEHRQAFRRCGRHFEPAATRHQTLRQRKPEPAAAENTDGIYGVTSKQAS
jgi:hypothetical protein